ncbi:MAG TPA: hypothetical protein ENH55_24055 [Aurantimonas coralicida]|uniref:Uncharacterized protein n=2 Tax=root TaxID=1 RepID=A0A9C9TJG6_9HYPH|nr:hypothetical protein [Aurantimonas coralicida]HEU03409.1 hypothetical protein [Aurantimonas coralicida]
MIAHADQQQLQSVYDPTDLNDADTDTAPPAPHLTREQAVPLSKLAYPRRIAANGVDLRDRVRALRDTARRNCLHELM